MVREPGFYLTGWFNDVKIVSGNFSFFHSREHITFILGNTENLGKTGEPFQPNVCLVKQ